MKLNFYIVSELILNGKMRKRTITLIAVLLGFLAAGVSYGVLARSYGAARLEVFARTDGQSIPVTPKPWEEVKAANAGILAGESENEIVGWGNIYQNVQLQALPWEKAKELELHVLTDSIDHLCLMSWENAERSKPDVLSFEVAYYEAPEEERLAVARYEPTREEESKRIISFYLHETEPSNILPLSASLGIATGVIVLAVWVGYRRAWGDITTTFVEQGLHDMTLRDIEIAGYARESGEFTIPQLMKLAKASKLTVWRSIQKLIEKGLVQPTDQTRPSANGLGGRGKPSRVYRYLGRIEREG